MSSRRAATTSHRVEAKGGGRRFPRRDINLPPRAKGRQHGEASMSAGGEMVFEVAEATRLRRGCSEGCPLSTGSGRRKPLLAPWQEQLAKNLMHRRLASSVTISDLASICRLSVSYFVSVSRVPLCGLGDVLLV